MKPKLYVETSVIGYLASRHSQDHIVAGNQQMTHCWWDERRTDFDVYISQIVVDECKAGDPVAAQERLVFLDGIPVLAVTVDTEKLALELMKEVPLPTGAHFDALHIAVATVHGIDYLMTWNCSHIANAMLQNRIQGVCRKAGWASPTICTPQELMKA